jgi:hypothetical protein
MQRETKEIVLTTTGKKVLVKTYLTGREVTGVMKAKASKSDVEVATDLIGVAVVSVDGVTENVTDLVLDLPIADYLTIANTIKDLSGGNFQKAE